ncbi:MAG: metabolite traffic protein EboE [Bryobacteraceae bacterium]
MRVNDTVELTYCTNIHPANGWPDVFATLRQYGPALKASLSPDAPFGIGLRMSAAEAKELRSSGHLGQFRDFLLGEGLYVALINGFPYGSFHGTPVKAGVFAPDWKDEERVRYTSDLIGILSELLPDGTDGGVSTAPLSYKQWTSADDEASWDRILHNVLRCVEQMAGIRRDTGHYIHLDIEPEPDGLIENTREFVAFFYRLLALAAVLAERLQTSVADAEQCIRDHVCVCLDICHFAVEFENPEEALAAFQREGIRVGRVQVSSALRVPVPAEPEDRTRVVTELARFVDPVYLHQVIGHSPLGRIDRYPDLPHALNSVHDAGGSEWRIHFHVPIFIRDYAAFGSTQDVILDVLRLLNAKPFTRHLEIETYTWSVLPPELKYDLLSSIEREYRWVLDRLCAKPQSSTSSV